MDLQTFFYALGIVVFISQLIFFVLLGVAAWYAYKIYQTTRKKMGSIPALFLAKKVIGNPMKVGTGMMVFQLLSSAYSLWQNRKKKRKISFG